MKSIEPIKTTSKMISVEGKVFYNDRRRRIDVKKPIRDLFESDETFDVKYMMEVCLSPEKLSTRVIELTNNKVMPVLLYFLATKRGGENA